MKQTLTVLTLLIAGTAMAQPETATGRLPLRFRREIALRTLNFPGTPASILAKQRADREQGKTAATAYRLTGWSRYDGSSGALTDSSTFRYSGSRGSRFTDEYENSRTGMLSFNCASDYHATYDAPAGSPLRESETIYDAADHVIQDVIRGSFGKLRITNTYDAQGRLATTTEADSSAAGWVPARLYKSGYNAGGQRSRDSVFDLPAMELQYITRHHYDAVGNPDTVEGMFRGGNSWYTDYLLTYTYDKAGNILTTTQFQQDANWEMEPMSLFEYKYDAAARMTESKTSVYDNGTWKLQARDSLGYTGAKRLYTYERTQIMDDATQVWKEHHTSVYALNAQNRWSTSFISSPDSTGKMLPLMKVEYNYNSGGLLTKMETVMYDRTQNTYHSAPSITDNLYYETHQTTGLSSPAAALQLKAYPNPAGAVLNLEAPGAAISQIEILSPAGQRVAVLQGTGGAILRIDVAELPAGLYFLQARLQGQRSASVLRFVKI